MKFKYDFINAQARHFFDLNPSYTWAVENFERMSKEIPNFEKIYEGRSPQRFEVIEQTATHVRVAIPDEDPFKPARWEWHRKDFYFIIPKEDFSPISK